MACEIRAAIEDDYAKRLAKLAKLTLGKDEIGYVCKWVSALVGLRTDAEVVGNYAIL